MDIIYILGNLHRFIRSRRRPGPPAPAPAGMSGLAVVAARKVKPSDRAFLTWTVVAAGFLIGVIGVLWTML